MDKTTRIIITATVWSLGTLLVLLTVGWVTTSTLLFFYYPKEALVSTFGLMVVVGGVCHLVPKWIEERLFAAPAQDDVDGTE